MASSNNERAEELQICKRVLLLTKSGKLDWDYDLLGQVWSSAEDIFFTLYFANAVISDNDKWRRFDVEEKPKGYTAGSFTPLFALANAKDPVGASLGLRTASPTLSPVLDELFVLLLANAKENTYGKVFSALDKLGRD